MPRSIQDYTHRIGRTGRAGQQGFATSLVTAENKDVFVDLYQMLSKGGHAVPREIADHAREHSRQAGRNTRFG
ncbi:MAG: hypothetical protein MHM6MM_005625 [Cercozoa sp. M6MM]